MNYTSEQWDVIETIQKLLIDKRLDTTLSLVEKQTEEFVIGQSSQKSLIGSPVPIKRP